jgi:hypothetical protein
MFSDGKSAQLSENIL